MGTSVTHHPSIYYMKLLTLMQNIFRDMINGGSVQNVLSTTIKYGIIYMYRFHFSRKSWETNKARRRIILFAVVVFIYFWLSSSMYTILMTTIALLELESDDPQMFMVGWITPFSSFSRSYCRGKLVN